jgi:hypothetical protein
MIELTLRANYDKVWLMPRHIIWLFPHDGGTNVHITDDMSFDVVENITEIRKKLAAAN